MNNDLDWSNASDPDGDSVSYKVYFGTDSSPDDGEYKTTTSTSSYLLPELSYKTDYYWRIDTTDGSLTTTGDVWHFKTGPSAPVAGRKNPTWASGTMDIGESRSFVVEAWDEDEGLDYVNWYVDGNFKQKSGTGLDFWGAYGDDSSGSISFDSGGEHTVKAVVYDHDGLTDEITWTITVNTPDLQGSGSYQNKDYYPGDTVVFDFVVLNAGQASANAGSVYYYAHKGEASYSSSYKIGEDSYDDLDPGDTSSQRFWWHIPTDAPAGIYCVSFWVDAENTTPNESDEENNKGAWFVEVKERPGPDRRHRIIYPGLMDRSNISWFIHISDAHIGNGLDEVDHLEEIRDTAYTVIKPDFIVNTGDLVESEGKWEWPLGDPGEGCCDWQDEHEWNEYYNIVNVPGFRENYYDLPGNHDRYGDPEWDGNTENDGYANNSIRGPSSNPIGQFMWLKDGNYFISVNTCDETGDDMDFYSLILEHISDKPELSDYELDDLEVKLIQSHNDPNGNLVFVFGHHSIFTRPDHPKNPGLYDERIDEEYLNARGAEEFVRLLNDYQVFAYGFGHTHEPEVFIEEEGDDVPCVSSVQVNPGALGEHGEYAIVAVDNGGVSTTTATVGNDNWPVVLITAPVDIGLGGDNPYCYPLPKHEGSNNKIRSLVFNPDNPDDPSDDLTEGDPTDDSDGVSSFAQPKHLVSVMSGKT